MSDEFKTPEFTLEEEEIIEEIPKELDEGTLTDDAKPVPNPEEEGTPFFGNIISPDSKTGTVLEEQIKGAIKIIDKVQGKEVEEDASLIESLNRCRY